VNHWPGARHLAGLVLAAALVTVAVSYARALPQHAPTPPDPRTVGWMSTHPNLWADTDGASAAPGRVFDLDGSGPVRANPVTIDNHWTRIDQPDRNDWRAAVAATGR
jgi:hypothetical protein